MPYIGKKPADIIATAVDTTTGTFSGEVDAASLDISGNIDVDGTTNLDVVDIDGAVDMASTLTVGGAFTSLGIDDNADATAITIDSSEDVFFGKTSGGQDTVGVKIESSAGAILATRSQAVSGLFTRLSNDGEIVRFMKDTTTVGSIHSQGGDSLIVQAGAGSGSGLHMHGGNGVITPSRNGAVIDNTIDLGGSSNRFKDIYLSGGVNFSANANASGMSSELLDDYEEGSWTPGVSGRTFTSVFGSYTKVGNLVTVYFDVNTMAGGDVTNPSLTGLPFTSTNSSSFQYAGYLTIQEPNAIGISSGFTYVYFRVSKNGTTGTMLQAGGTGSTVAHNSGVVMSNGDHFRGVGQYFSDA